MSKPELPLPVLTPAAREALDRAFQFAYGRLVATRLTEARMRLVEAYGDVYSQERVSRRVGKSQTWLSNLEVGQRRVDTTAMLMLGALYGVPLELLVMPASGKRETDCITLWMREYRALARTSESSDLQTSRRGGAQSTTDHPRRQSR